MIKILTLAAMTLATPAIASGVRVTDCKLSEPLGGFIQCNVANETSTAIAKVSYNSQISEEGRTVDWFSSEKVETRDIDGGIEPGETLSLVFLSGKVGKNADQSKLKITLKITDAFDVNGNPITTP